jgi:2-polyprenyl-6-hydroxyphenyl methylase/3-demethylubiquinone-9 3-methyltransferase
LFPSPFVRPEDPQKIYGDPDKYFANHDEAAKVASLRVMIDDLRSRIDGPLESLLDIGSGQGEMLVAAEQAGVRAVGLEFSQAMIDAAGQRGFTVRRQSAEEHAAEGHTYDAVTLAAVIEHVYDPDSLVAAIATLLRPGGIVYIECPNEPNLLSDVVAVANRARRSKAVINLSPSFSPFHVYGFNPGAMRRLLDKHGFDVVDLKIRARLILPAQETLPDKVQGMVASLVHGIATRTGRASNMEVLAVPRRRTS